jgi:DNA-binding IclR family transcriptional regulator
MNGPGKREKPGRSYGSRTLEKGLDVLHFLASGDILGWKSLRQVAAGAGVTLAEAHAALHPLLKRGLAEKAEKAGAFRAAAGGLGQYALKTQEALVRYGQELGLTRQRKE